MLLIEDTADAMDTVGSRLREAGHDVRSLVSRPEALTLLAHQLLALAGHARGAAREIPRDAPRAAHPHAAVRWAGAVVPIVDSPTDPRTVADWSRWIAASPGALRTWCATAGIEPRRSLVFGRLLRAVVLSDGGRHKPENLLDVVDRRTLAGLVTLSGLGLGDFPADARAFLDRQTLVRDPDALAQVTQALEERQLFR